MKDNNIDSNYINMTADKLRVITKLVDPPYDPFIAVDRLNGKIVYSDEIIDPTINCITTIPRNNFTINLHNNKNNLQKRFSLAKELGYLFLHLGYGTYKWANIDLTIPYKINPLREQQAIEFAMCFFIPKDNFTKITSILQKKNECDKYKLSQYYQIEEEYILKRMNQLHGLTNLC